MTKIWKNYCRENKIKKKKDCWNWRRRKKIYNELFNSYFSKYQNPSDMYKKLCETKGKINEDQVYSIKEVFDKIIKPLKMCLKIKYLILKKTKR